MVEVSPAISQIIFFATFLCCTRIFNVITKMALLNLLREPLTSEDNSVAIRTGFILCAFYLQTISIKFEELFGSILCQVILNSIVPF